MPLHPDYPVIEGYHQLTPAWALDVEQPVNRRIEDGSMVLWRPGFTAWLNIWRNEARETVEQRAKGIESEVSPHAHDIISETSDGLFRHAYRLEEESGSNQVYAYYGHVVAPDSHVQIAIYFDAASELAAAKALVASITYDDDD